MRTDSSGNNRGIFTLLTVFPRPFPLAHQPPTGRPSCHTNPDAITKREGLAQEMTPDHRLPMWESGAKEFSVAIVFY